MAAQTQTSSDNISHINDEDVLRKMVINVFILIKNFISFYIIKI